ncbi:MAG: hypothetical protein AAGD43_00550 [Pseudomonadota bacterium]
MTGKPKIIIEQSFQHCHYKRLLNATDDRLPVEEGSNAWREKLTMNQQKIWTNQKKVVSQLQPVNTPTNPFRHI